MNPPISEHDELFRMATDMSPAGILAVDAQGVILLANQEIERLFGWTREELLGQRISVLLPSRYRHGHDALIQGFFAQPDQRPMGSGRDLRGVRKDGSEFPVEIGLRPVKTSRGVVTLASVLDVTARLEREKASRQSQKLEALGTLAGGIAHDFNNILMAIVGHSELARMSHGDTASHDLEQVMSAAERGRQLVQRILAFSRTREVKRAPVDLTRVVREAADLLRSSLPSTVEMKLTLSPATPKVLSDEIELHQVVMNLCTNAAHAMPAGGPLIIDVAAYEPDAAWRERHPGLPAGKLARLVVRDHGTGMPAEVVERIFEPFYTTKPAGQGTGLGLSVVHGIIREHGGTIEVQSTLGKGTTFTIVLPAAPINGHSEPEPTDDRPKVARLLVVEDEEGLGKMQKRLLEGMGYHVTLHVASTDALEEFRSRPDEFDLMVTDNTMPRMTGLQLTAEVHKIRPELPVLMVSGLAERAENLDLGALGVRIMLRKPHTSKQLDEAIREALGPR